MNEFYELCPIEFIQRNRHKRLVRQCFKKYTFFMQGSVMIYFHFQAHGKWGEDHNKFWAHTLRYCILILN